MKKITTALKALMVGAALALGPGLALATGPTQPDVSDVVTFIGGTSTPIGLIGSAVLLVLVGIKVFKWVRRAM